MRKGWFVTTFIVLILMNGFWLYSYNLPGDETLAPHAFLDMVWGSITAVADLLINVQATSPNITIYSPENKTYYFNLSQSFDIDLNVSADLAIANWWYDLYNQSGTLIYDDVIFTPNSSLTGVKNSNRLIVYANSTLGGVGNANVTFFIRLVNAAPTINLSEELFVCEEDFLSHLFNITNPSEEDLTISIFPPAPPFYVAKVLSLGNITTAEIFSGYLYKYNVGFYPRSVSAAYGNQSDTAPVNITTIEINHHPYIEYIGVQTVWVNDTWYYQVYANDTEDGNATVGNLTFNITFTVGTQFFTVNQTLGVINITPTDLDLGIYNITICVEDQGITPHANISLCGPEQDGNPFYNCTDFTLTITDQNRPPNITSQYPTEMYINVSALNNTIYNITTYDPDRTTPDAYWYIDGQLKAYGSGINNYSKIFSGDDSGTRNVSVEITDGELNDSASWMIFVIAPPKEGGGGGGGGSVCNERWVCNETAECQSISKLHEGGLLDLDSRKLFEIDCLTYGWGKEECGIQLLDCYDLFNCKTTYKKPKDTKACYYTQNPSCDDKIRNCHDGGCEVLVDCGGPCNQCPTCHDGKKNQNEEGTDCGGPCPKICPKEKPLAGKLSVLFYVTALATLILVAIIIFALTKLIKVKKRLDYHENPEEQKTEEQKETVSGEKRGEQNGEEQKT